MLNMIKMDVYRMFRTKSMYVIWIILLASALLTSFLSKIDYDATNKEWEKQQAVESQADTDTDMQAADVVNAQDIEQQQAVDSNKEQLSQQNTDNVNLGMSVELPTEPGKKVTVMDVFFSNAQGKFYALFLVIFAVMFGKQQILRAVILRILRTGVTKDSLLFQGLRLPYLQQLPCRGYLYSRQQRICLRLNVWVWGNWKEIIPYFLTELMLHYAFVLICMAIAVIIKNNVISMTLSVSYHEYNEHCVCPYRLCGHRVGLHNFNI